MKELDIYKTDFNMKTMKQSCHGSFGSVTKLLIDRELGNTKGPNMSLLKFAEEKAATSEMKETYCQLPSSVRSTFLMSFSPDCSKVASTHGDHKIYICDVKSGKLLHKLEGHPRTPWCLQFHPTSNDIVASGCLGGEVRVWDLHGGSEIWNAPQATVITSLTFHPFDKVLVIATQNELHFWNWSESEPFAVCKTKLTKEKVRFVKFDSLGNKLITGISNINNNQNSTGEPSCCTPSMPSVPPSSPTSSSTFPRQAVVFSQANTSSAIRSAVNRAHLLNQPVALRRKIYVRTHRTLLTNRQTNTVIQPRVEPCGAFRPTVASEIATANKSQEIPEQSTLVNNSCESQSNTGIQPPQLTIVETGNWELQSSSLSTSTTTSSSTTSSIRLPIDDSFPLPTIPGVGDAMAHSPASIQPQSSVESQSPLSAESSSPALPHLSNTSPSNLSSSTLVSSSSVQPSSTQSLIESNSQLFSMLSSIPSSSVRPSSDNSSSISVSSTRSTAQPSSGIINSNLPINRRTLLSRLMNMYRQVEVFQEMERNEGSFRSHSPTESDALHRARNYARAKTTQASQFGTVQNSHSTMERNQDPSRSRSPTELPHPSRSSTQTMTQASRFRDTEQRGPSMLMPFKKRFKADQNLKQSRASKLLCKASTSTSTEENHDADSKSNDSSEDSDNNNEEIGEAFEHIETLCESLEDMLRNPRRPLSVALTSERHAQVSSEVRFNRGSFTDFPAELADDDSGSDRSLNQQAGETSRRPNVNRYRDSERWGNALDCFECVLTRSQHYLQIAAIRNTIAPEQIQQVRFRLTEILECLTNLATFRAQVKNFYRRAIEGSYQHRSSDTSQHEYMDLSHCIWLLELCVQLCREMKTYFQRNSTPAQLQTISSSEVTSTSLENSDTVDASESRLASGSSIQNSPSQRRIANLLHLPPSQLSGLPSSFSPLSLRFRETITQLHNNRNQLMQVSREIDRLRDNLDDLNQPTSSQGGRSDIPSGSDHSSVINDPVTVPRRVLPRFLYALDSPEPLSPGLNRIFCLSSRLPRRRMELPRPARFLGVTVPSSHIGSSSERQGRYGRSLLYSTASSANVTGRSNFYIPEVHIESSSDSADEGPLPASERPRSPPLSAILQGIDELTGTMSPAYTAMVFEAGSRLGIHEGTISFTHRIQLWDFSKYELPDIGIEDHNVIVPRCKIHNDASVDISKDGEVLVALVPSRPTCIEPLIFGVYSLRPGSLGLCLCTWGFESNAISVSLSPLGQYVVVGLARPYVSSPEKEAVAQIFKLRPVGTFYNTVHIRSLTQLINNENRYPQVSLNSVQWLPQPGQGLIYGTNRGCLCISKPRAPMTLKKSKLFFQNSLMQSSSISLGLNLGVSNRNSEVSTMSTQTTHPSTQTTGTQTFSSENASAGR